MSINNRAMRIFVSCICMAVFMFIDISKSTKIKTWGPYEVIIRRKSDCVDEGTREIILNITSLRFLTRSEFIVKGRFHINFTLDDSFTITYNHAHWGNGGWRPNFMTFEFPNGCSKLKEIYPGPFEYFVQLFNETSTTECSLGPGTADFEFTMGKSATIPALKAMPYSRLKGEMIIKKDGQIKGCIGGIADIVPKNGRS